jgi:adenylosuccinate synthase
VEYGASNNSNNGKFSMADDEIEYREAIRNQITREVRKITDLEKQKAVQTLMEEQSKAMHQIIEEYTNAIRYVAQKEKEEIWRKAKAFKKSFV